MIGQRQILRTAPRAVAQLRAPVLRSAVQRRFASNENNFVKERQAIKEHAAGTTGQSPRPVPCPLSLVPCPAVPPSAVMPSFQ